MFPFKSAGWRIPTSQFKAVKPEEFLLTLPFCSTQISNWLEAHLNQLPYHALTCSVTNTSLNFPRAKYQTSLISPHLPYITYLLQLHPEVTLSLGGSPCVACQAVFSPLGLKITQNLLFIHASAHVLCPIIQTRRYARLYIQVHTYLSSPHNFCSNSIRNYPHVELLKYFSNINYPFCNSRSQIFFIK